MSEQTMRDVSQRNPLDPENVFGRVFRRGPDVAADGGEHAAGVRPSEETVSSGGKRNTGARPPEGGASPGGARATEAGNEGQTSDGERVSPSEQTMKHVDQTPPGEGVDSNHVWERGGEAAPGENDEDTDE